MHRFAKEIMEWLKPKAKAEGYDNIGGSDLEQFKCWTEIAKNVAEYDYYYHITEAMEKPENQYGVNYDENGKFYTQPRDNMGRYMSRGYSHDPNMVHYRDMDYPMGRMYYTDSSNMGNSSNRMYSESRYDRAKRGYEESKEMNPDMDNSKSAKELMTVIKEDIKRLKPHMTTNEKNMVSNEFSEMASMMMM